MAADAASTALQAVFGADLVAVVLFGSVLHGRERPDSDVDLLVVLETLPRLGLRWDHCAPALEPVETALRIERPCACLSPLLRTPAEVRHGNPVYYDLTLPQEREILHDPTGFIAAYLADLAARMAHYGSRRVLDGPAPYWILAPGHDIRTVDL